ncbi:pilus motility taxis protein HmpF [Synechococcus sp. BDU 130192]|uniref:pilus motility taxis protein HmpF n=1 Tax=Synechococcus sp. BDU 130192 TaxID=2042059 RepID=UPI000C08CFC8|nr:pilus motility taxis protein HmpF [Synechococcus sp. BDU 130192]
MLYLAEVKKTKGFMGSKTEIKLLACERNDRSWSTVPGEELVPADELSNFNDGTLVVVNLGNNRTIQGSPEIATNRLLTVLQNFSRLMDKSKSQEEEIEQWRQSLTYQADELNRRQEEMNSRLDQIEETEAELQKLQDEKLAFEKLKAEADEIKAEFARKQTELEGAWQQLRGEQQRLANLQEETDGQGLSPAIATKIQQILVQCQSNNAPTDEVRTQLGELLDELTQQEELFQTFAQYPQQLQELETQLAAIATQVQTETTNVEERRQALENAKTQLQIQRQLLQAKQSHLNQLATSRQRQEDMQDLLNNLAAGMGGIEHYGVDLAAIEAMPLGELETTVEKLRDDLDKLVRFVNDQEEELTLQHEAVGEIKASLATVEPDNVMELQELEEELRDEEEKLGMLNQTLVGQRRTLRERQGALQQHLRILKRRQGIIEVEAEQNIDLSPAIAYLEDYQEEDETQKQKLEAEIEAMHHTIQQLENILMPQERELAQQQKDLEQKQAEYEAKQREQAQLQGKIQLYQGELLPLKDTLEQIIQSLRTLENSIHQFLKVNEQQQQLAQELEQTMAEATHSP